MLCIQSWEARANRSIVIPSLFLFFEILRRLQTQVVQGQCRFPHQRDQRPIKQRRSCKHNNTKQ